MKNTIYKITLLVLIGLTTVSCKKFLEKEPIGRIGKQVLFEDVNGARLALNGVYHLMLKSYRNEFGMYADIASDNLLRKSAATSTMIQQFDFRSTVGDDEFAVGVLWLGYYENLNHINNVLAAIEPLKSSFPGNAEELEGIRAQALVLRAMCHFDLSRVYAQPYNFTQDASHLGIPLVTKTPSPGERVVRNTMKETYDQIIKDITDALPELRKLPYNQMTVNYYAAEGLLSRVYLYMGDWEKSIDKANKVINDGSFKLVSASAYKAMFVESPASASAKSEVLFQFTNIGLVANANSINAVYSDTLAAEYNASAKLLSSYASGDIRKSAMFYSPSKGSSAGKQFTAKYSNDGKTTRNDTVLVKVIRLSELYLNRAEAKWHQEKYSEAAEDIRIVAQRARPNETVSIDYSNPQELYEQIASERNRELAFENHRLFDIVRRKENLQRGADCNASTCLLTYPNNKFVLPIPIKEIEANSGMVQNPGYN